jgi:hypothetical protein
MIRHRCRLRRLDPVGVVGCQLNRRQLQQGLCLLHFVNLGYQFELNFRQRHQHRHLLRKLLQANKLLLLTQYLKLDRRQHPGLLGQHQTRHQRHRRHQQAKHQTNLL